MKQDMTYEDLVMLERDISQQRQSKAFEFFNRQKIQAFYAQNKERLSIAHRTITGMLMEHVKKDEEGRWMQVKVDDEFVKWAFYTEADEEEYKAKYEAFMKRTITVFC